MAKRFRAPWGTGLKVSTAVFLGILLSISLQTEPLGDYVLLGIVVLCAAFAVRGYSIVDGQLIIHRLGWARRLDLAKLCDVAVVPNVTVGSIRTFGIGGFFGFIGWFHNPVLGSYRAYATDAAKAVLLDFGTEKVIVTPESPDDFVTAVRLAGAA